MEALHAAQLRHILGASPVLMALLRVVREAGPPGAYIAAGAIRDRVWDHLTQRPASDGCADVDVVYFDAQEPAQRAGEYECALAQRAPAVCWEVTNQAWVHAWHAETEGRTFPPHQSLLEGLATWPETATAVGVRLDAAEALHVIAPFGLADLFQLQLRHNPLRASAAVYRARVESKQWARRWPELTIFAPHNCST